MVAASAGNNMTVDLLEANDELLIGLLGAFPAFKEEKG